MKTIYLFLVCLLLTSTLNAQTFQWAKTTGGSLTDVLESVVIDATGNVISTGYFRGTVDFDPGVGTANLTSLGDVDIFVLKTDANGNFLWAGSFGGHAQDLSHGIAVDASGNIYVTGYFLSTADFHYGAGSAILTGSGSGDVFVMKMDPYGNYLWAKSMGGTSLDHSYAIAVDALGNAIITGTFRGSADFDPGSGTAILTSAGNEDIFVVKLDPFGNYLWAKSMGGNLNERGNAITADAGGNVYVTGQFQGTVDFDPGAGTTNLTSASSNNDVFVLKLDASGTFQWAHGFGSTSSDIGRAISHDTAGNVLITGNFYSTMDVDPGAGITNLSAVGGSDIFVLKLDASGNYLWAKSFGNGHNDFVEGISMDSSGHVYTTGYFRATVDFDPGMGISNHTAIGYYDVFVHKMDASGDFHWARTFGGSGYDKGLCIVADISGNVYTAGVFYGTVDFDPGSGTDNHLSLGNEDLFIQKMSVCTGMASPVNLTVCDAYTWPCNGMTYMAPGIYTCTYIHTDGCFYSQALQLNIINSSLSTHAITACDAYTWMDGNTYTVSTNTALFVTTNAVGCDSIITLDLIIHSVSDVSTTLNGITLTANNANASYQWLDCQNNYTPIPGATAQSFTPLVNGSYAVELTEQGCVDTSACKNVSTVGVSNPENNIQVLVYPNPFTASICIQFDEMQEHVVCTLTDMQGKLVSQYTYDTMKIIPIDLQVASGIYFLTVQTPKGQKRFKLNHQ